ncbi:Do family serine endopeptidase [Enterovirga aerilata]|uniref:Probable periplasmic serine endoprotease DegP-like n=1 Tax=Enterovirga aerilata TaxID=2730920 RepID=A0A849I763_9HYPH|nr:Do family serine endopeptidase [Enterovirga sp. DB1703]NNM71920.1 Do family serine endopeptidase [Enterovirga sp. DB1703]
MSNTVRTTGTLRSRALASVAAVAIVASGALGATVLQGQHPALAQSAPITVESAQAPASFADVVDKVKPAVVSVRVRTERASFRDGDGPGSRLDELPPQLREFFRRFGENGVPNGPRRGGRGMAQGSGFFISADGYVVTNNHVVDDAKSVEVTTDDGRTLTATVLGTDPKSDLALLKVTEGGPFPYVKLATNAPRVGDWVVAIGNPFGLGGTVTSGIVSARGRDIGAGPYDDFLQIDAPINRGNSGGPTFNLRGEVVGVNTAIASPSGGSVGLAFAIPSQTVQAVVDQLRTNGKVERGYLGLQIQALTPDLAEGLGLKTQKGALVNSAQASTPAAKAGLQAGDVVTSVNGEPISDARELSRKIASLKPGSKVEIGYLRDGGQRTATVELGTLPNETASLQRQDDGRSSLRLGLQLAPGSRIGEEGVAVVAVDPDGPAAQRGISEGDVILEVGGKAVSDPSEVAAGIKAARDEGKKAVVMRVKNRQGTRFVAIGLRDAG